MSTENTLNIENSTIRKNWDEQANDWCYSIVDVIAIITPSSDPRNYWKVIKNRLKKAQNKLVTECNQLKMLATDGKYYLTDTASKETILEIIKLIAPQYFESFKQGFDDVSEKGLKNISNYEKTSLAESPIFEDKNLTYPQLEKEVSEFLLLVDGYFENNFMIIEAFIAGLDTNNLFIKATCDELTIEGARRMNEIAHDIQELSWGKFSRTIPLPHEIDINKIETKEKDGYISIRLPLLNKNISKVLKLNSI